MAGARRAGTQSQHTGPRTSERRVPARRARTHTSLLTRDDRPRSRVSVQGPGTSGPGWSSSIHSAEGRARNRSIALAATSLAASPGSRAARVARRPSRPPPPRRGGPFYDVNRALGCNIIPIYLYMILLNTETDCLRGPIDCMLLAALARPTLGSHRSSGASSRRQGPRWSVRRW